MVGKLKFAEEAKGIPSRSVFKEPPKIDKPTLWQLVIHKHLAERAGEHRDLRLLDSKTGITYNWATRKLPEPGKGTYAIFQPTHAKEYLGWEGTIPEGYGAGKVSIERKEPVELRASSPKEVRFNAYNGRVPEQYVLRHTEGKKWVLFNATPSRETKRWGELIPSDRPRYKEKKVDAIDLGDENELMQGKVDGTQVLGAYEKGKPIRLLSYREAKSTPTKFLEHTFKVPFHDFKTPEALDKTLVRGELYAVDRKGRAIPAEAVGSLVNANTWKSRQLQEERKERLRLVPFDVLKYRGKNVQDKPYSERFELLKRLVSKSPKDVELPETAFNEPQKYRLLKKILEGKLKQTQEGVVLWHRDQPVTTKVKKNSDYDVHVRDVYPSTHEGWAGGFDYSLTPKGKVVGRVGGGFTHALREEMVNNPGKFKGRVAKVRAQGMFPSGALRAPEFSEWRID